MNIQFNLEDLTKEKNFGIFLFKHLELSFHDLTSIAWWLLLVSCL